MTQKKAGVLLNYVLTFVHILSGIIYVPLLLSFLSGSDYGVYKLIGGLIGLIGVMDFGLSNTVIRYYSASKEKKDEKGAENILAICLIIFLIITFILIIIGIVTYFLIPIIFGNSLLASEITLAKVMFIILFVNLAITIPSKIFTASIFANEKFVFIKSLQIFQGVLTPVCVLLFLFVRSSAITVTIVQTVSNLVGIILTIIYAIFKCKVKIKLHHFNKKLVREIFVFSFFIFLAMIVDQLYWRCDSIIIGAFIGSIGVTIYSISSSLCDYFKQFSVSVGSVFMPELARIDARGGSVSEMDKIFRKTGRIQNVIMFLLLSGFTIFGIEFISIWTRASIYKFTLDNIKLIYFITLAVFVPLYIPSVQSTGVSILQAKNKHRFRSITYFIIAILNFAFSILLVKFIGIWGCVIATSASLFIGQGIIMNIYYAKIGLDIKKFFAEIIKMTFPLFIFAVLCYLINIKIQTASIWILGAKIFVYTAGFALITYFASLSSYEKNLIKGLFRKNGLQWTNEKHNIQS